MYLWKILPSQLATWIWWLFDADGKSSKDILPNGGEMIAIYYPICAEWDDCIFVAAYIKTIKKSTIHGSVNIPYINLMGVVKSKISP